MGKTKKILFAFIIPLILASFIPFVTSYVQSNDKNLNCKNGVCFGPYDDYVTPNLEYLGYCFIGLILLAFLMPTLLILREKQIVRTKLDLTED
jgi:TM2 domain-containing membrane protein YozV